ncbi:uncharacterized protein [Phyllobates terribilis]|uniref:uncharacterized protein n=1 Tax=Phyllobates terribilis TaxID=111132 RepID=UPI003CCABA5A
MGYFGSWVIYLIISSSLNLGATASNSNETDRLALLAFKANILDDPFEIMPLWNDSAHFCEWYGVTCSSRHQRVTQLRLLSLKLRGSIPPHIGNLSFLHILELTNNDLIHQIPEEIGALKRLKVLDLMNNSLGGEIPVNLSRCSQLRSLILSNNKLEGVIPIELGRLSKLQSLGASKNNLTGTIPLSLGNLTLLQDLRLAFNSITGWIPTTLGSLNRLTSLVLGFSNLYGEVPSSIFNLSSLEMIDIGGNKLSGHLPPSLFNTLPKLFYFSVALNQFSGPIPVSLSNASNLQFLQLLSNKFEGKVPSTQNLHGLVVFRIYKNQLGSGARGQDDLSFLCSLTNATSLTNLQVHGNSFGGMFPTCITNLSSQLQWFTMDNNYIHGSIPQEIDNLKGLQILSISNNLFTGIIPPTIGNLGNLIFLYLDHNNLLGLIPFSFGKLSKLVSLDLSFNSLEGAIPLSLKSCTFLQRLNLSNNKLNGSIPTQILQMPSLSLYLMLSDNQLSGPLPEEVGKLMNLYMFDVSANRLSGELPDSLGECTSMQILGLYSNSFQGSIPSSWGLMRGLQVLDLAYNNLSGLVPNNGVFTNASATSLQGNSRLCGGIPQFHLSECRSSHVDRKNRTLSLKLKIIITTVAGLVVVLLGLILCVRGIVRMKRRKTKAGVIVAQSDHHALQFVSYGDIHRATNSFSKENMFGMGSFGQVYRGILHKGGEVVAIKVLKLDRLGAAKSFVTECEALRNIKHKNLVKLITVCSSVDYQGNEFKALIYEFMSNGSLQEWLHPIAVKEENTIPGKLSLVKRLGIAIDVASVLEYVHHEVGTPLVHCDIKTSNILLDSDFSGRLSDFGLAKFLVGRGLDQPSSSGGVRGTVGYAPPEYGIGNEVSIEGDVYSYGIVLLEMLTGKRPTDEMFREGLSLHLYAKMASPDGILNILDPSLREFDERDLHSRRSIAVLDCLVSLVEIGVECSLESPAQRMKTRIITTKLHKIRDDLLIGK